MTNLYSAETHVFKINPDAPDLQVIALAAQILLRQGLVAFPTETVYGLGANALDEVSVGKIFEVKRRPFYDPLIVHIAERSQIEDVAVEIPDIAFQLAEKFWPGPLTLVLKRHERIAHNVSAGLGTVAVRMPDHPVPLALIKAAGVPVAAPSANLFSRPSPTSAQHVVDDLGGHVDIILDGGSCLIGLESTVLDLTSHTPAILRPGGTPAEALKAILPQLVIQSSPTDAQESGAKPSPGMMLKHYSPKARFLLFTGAGEEADSNFRKIIAGLLSRGCHIGLLATEEDASVYHDLNIEIEILGRETDLEEIGQNLFAKMRLLDKNKVDLILMRSLQSEGLGLAIGDRLFKAAEQQVMDLEAHSAADLLRTITDQIQCS